jgi:hypothetical protein
MRDYGEDFCRSSAVKIDGISVVRLNIRTGIAE